MDGVPLVGLLCLLALGTVLAGQTAEDVLERAVEEGRGHKLKKAIMPMLLGVVLKASTLVPMSLMMMTFLALSALFAAKLALGLSAAVGAHSLWKKADSGGGSHLTELAAAIPHTAPGNRRRGFRPALLSS